MKKNSGFTLIEILMSITMLLILGVVAMMNFNTTLNSHTLGEEVSFFLDTITSLEQDLGKSISDYELHILPGKIYWYTTDIMSASYYLTGVTIEGQTGSILIERKIDNQWQDIKVYTYKNNHLIDNVFFKKLPVNLEAANTKMKYNLPINEIGNYKIEVFVGDVLKANPIYINYYTRTLDAPQVELVTLTGSTDYASGVILKNMIGKEKSFLDMDKKHISPPLTLEFVLGEDFSYTHTFMK